MSRIVVAALYHFVSLDNYTDLRQPLLNQMLENNIKGTLLLAREGINGTVAGTRSAIDRLLDWIRADRRLRDVNCKFSSDDEMPFYRSRVKLKKEIVTMGIEDIDPNRSAGTQVKPADWNALISDPETHQKMACGDARAACRIAVLDPELTLSQPGPVTAATGTDAIVHAVETFVTRRRNPLSTLFAREAWKLLMGSFETVLTRPDDIEARGGMLLGAAFAGMAIENSMLGATHSAANPLTARYGTVHGAAVGMLLPHVVRSNALVVDDEYRELARLSRLHVDGGHAPGEPLATHIEKLFSRTGLPSSLAECGIKEEEIPDLAEAAVGQWTAQFNPRQLNTEDFEALYRCAL